MTTVLQPETEAQPEKARITVLGGGSFGTALANIAAENGHPTKLWLRDADRAEEIRTLRENTRYLPGCALHQNLEPDTDLAACLTGAELILVSVPSKGVRDVLQQARPYLQPNQILVSTTKGIEAGTFKLMSQIIREEVPSVRIGVLSGPNLAKEIGLRSLTATVIASPDPSVRSFVQEVLGCGYFRVYANSDMYGVELAGALKNIYAIVSGLAAARGMGENTKAMLITRSLAEMSRFAVCLGANPMTFLGLAGVGDLIVTCTSPLSRNFRVGFAIGNGEPLEQAVASLGEVAEGINTLRLVKEKAKEMNITMPLVSGLYAILFERQGVDEVISQLMLREQSSDVEFVLPRGN